MSVLCRHALTCAVAFALAVSAAGQSDVQDRLTPTPPTKPATKAEQDVQAAKKLFVQAAVQHRQDRHLEAIRALEECLRLDPAAVPPRKLLAALYRIVGRTEDALECARTVTELAPEHSDAWQKYAELLREERRWKEAAVALKKASECLDLAQHADQQALIVQKLAGWYEKLNDADAVVAVSTRLLDLLEKNRDAFARSGFLSADEWATAKADAHERVGRANLKRKNVSAAEEAFREALRLFRAQDDPAGRARVQRVNLYLAEVELERGRHAQALDHLNQYLQTKPKEIEPYRLWVALHDKLDLARDKLRGLETFAQRDKANLPLQLLLAKQHADAGNFSEAQNVFLVQAREHPKPEVYDGLFRLYEQNSRMELTLGKLDEYVAVIDDDSKSEEARAAAKRHAQAMYTVLTDHPAMIRALLPLAQLEQMRQFRNRQNLKYRTFEVLASLAARSGELEAAEQLLRESLIGLRRFQEASVNEALIGVLLAQRKYRDVVDICEPRTRGDDNRFMYFYYMAVPLARLGKIDEALPAIDQAIVDAHSDAAKLAARLQKVSILSWARRHADAVAECQAALKEFPRANHVRQVRLALAVVYSAAREHAKAEQQLRILLERDPNDARVCNDLGYQLADQNRNLDEAERLIRRALALDRAERKPGDSEDDDEGVSGVRDNAAYVDSLGWVLFRRGKLAEARQVLEKAVALPEGKEDPSVWDHLGDVFFRVGEGEKAKAAWHTAQKLYLEERRTKKDGRLEEVERKLKLSGK